MQNRKKWEAPGVVTYGNVGVLTQQKTVCKTYGLGDDFAQTISDFSHC
jgi:hypothetical protein